MQKEIFSLIDGGDYTSAEAAVRRMETDFALDVNLPENLWRVANRYDKVEAYDYSRALCQRILTNYPADTYSTYAALQLAKLDAYELIGAGQYETALSVAEKMLVDFAGHKQVCRRVWEVANRYEKVGAVEYSRRLCERLVAAAGKDPYGRYAALQLAKFEAFDLIDAGKYEGAYSAAERMLADFAGHKQLYRRVWEVANRYENVEADEYSRRLCRRIVSGAGNSEYGRYAALQLAKFDAFDLIDAGEYESACSAAERMSADFAGQKQVHRRVWEVANRYEKLKAPEYSRRLCERIVSTGGQDEYGRYAALELAKLGAFGLIEAGDMKAAGAAVSQMMNDFAGHKQLSRRLYETAQMYADRGAFAEARELHSKIAATFAKDEYAARSAIAAAKFAIYDKIDANNFAGAEAAISKMKSDFAGEYLYEALDSLAEKFDKAGADNKAEEIWREIIQHGTPDSKAVVEAKARLAKQRLVDAIESGDGAAADSVVEQLKSEFANVGNRRLAMFTLADALYWEVLRCPADVNSSKTAGYLQRVRAIEENEVVGKIGRGGEELDACVVLAEAYERLGDYSKSIEYCRRVLRDYPGSRYDWSRLFMIGQCYENMIAAGQIEQSQAEPEIRSAYTKLLQVYPKCPAAAAAQNWLDGR
jgi:predicted negative regulator of RcsB-dependent stress response